MAPSQQSQFRVDAGARTARRIVTGHSRDGRAVLVSDDEIVAGGLVEDSETSDAGFCAMWATQDMPVDLSDAARAQQSLGEEHTIVGNGQGSVLRIGVLAPGARSPMHRTQSLDYGICLAGECEMELDGGARVTVRAGDVVIQRGTNHAWHNRSDHPCRFAWVLIDARPVEIDGQPLPGAWRHDPLTVRGL